MDKQAQRKAALEKMLAVKRAGDTGTGASAAASFGGAEVMKGLAKGGGESSTSKASAPAQPATSPKAASAAVDPNHPSQWRRKYSDKHGQWFRISPDGEKKWEKKFSAEELAEPGSATKPTPPTKSVPAPAPVPKSAKGGGAKAAAKPAAKATKKPSKKKRARDDSASDSDSGSGSGDWGARGRRRGGGASEEEADEDEDGLDCSNIVGGRRARSSVNYAAIDAMGSDDGY